MEAQAARQSKPPPGHWIKDCPTHGDPAYDQNVRRPPMERDGEWERMERDRDRGRERTRGQEIDEVFHPQRECARVVCTHYMRGKCKFGHLCRFLHPPSEVPEARPLAARTSSRSRSRSKDRRERGREREDGGPGARPVAPSGSGSRSWSMSISRSRSRSRDGREREREVGEVPGPGQGTHLPQRRPPGAAANSTLSSTPQTSSFTQASPNTTSPAEVRMAHALLTLVRGAPGGRMAGGAMCSRLFDACGERKLLGTQGCEFLASFVEKSRELKGIVSYFANQVCARMLLSPS